MAWSGPLNRRRTAAFNPGSQEKPMSRWKLGIPAMLATAAAAFTLTALPLHAAPPNKKKIMTDEPEAAEPGAAMPTVTGKAGKIHRHHQRRHGALWDLAAV